MDNFNIPCIGHKLQYDTQAAAHLIVCSYPQDAIRGRPLMIWGGGGKIENGFIFSAGMPFENYLFFPGEGPPRFFFSRFPPGFPPNH